MRPKVSICIPYHDSPRTAFFIARLLNSLEKQTLKDYEIVLLKRGRMGETYNAAIEQCKGEYIKLMGMDDYFQYPEALEDIVAAFDEDTTWLATGCVHDNEQALVAPHVPMWNERLVEGFNTLGGFAVITLRNKDIPKIDENLDWVVDCDWYWRLFQQNGPPKMIDNISVVIGIGPHQTTNQLSEEQKLKEHEYTKQKYA